MTALSYTDPARVLAVDVTARPWSGRTVSGYGGRIPTSHRVRYVGADGRARWHRVRVMIYGNGGCPYIVAGGVTLHLDIDTENACEATS